MLLEKQRRRTSRLRAKTVSAAAQRSAVASTRPRPRVDGKFIAVGENRLRLRGVTYGTFAPDAEGRRFPAPDVVERDFAAMAAGGINAVRTYTAPPLWLLDAALRHGLWVMVGLPWEQHIAFLDDRRRRRSIEADVRRLACAPAPGIRRVLCYAVGNEIPTPIVRWHGRQQDRALPRAPLRGGAGGGSGRARHLRQLSQHRVPAAAVPRPRLVQRLPRRRSRALAPLPGAAAEPRRRAAAAAGRDGPRQPPQRAGRPGRGASAGRSTPPSRPAAPARSCSPGRTSGTAARTRSRLGLRPDRPRPPAQAGAGRRCAGPIAAARAAARAPPGRASRWSSAPTTARATLPDCLDGLAGAATTPTTR